MAYENFDPIHYGMFDLDETVTQGRIAVRLSGGKLVACVNKTTEPLGILALEDEDIANGAATRNQTTKVQYHAIARVRVDGSGTAIASGDVLDAGAGGLLVKGALTTGWTIGSALAASASAGEIIPAIIRIQYVA